MPRRWAWLSFCPEDWSTEIVDEVETPVPHHARVALSRIRDGRIEHGETMRVDVEELWALIHWWVPSRGALWVWTGQPELAPRGVGLDRDVAGRWGWKRGHTRFGSDTCTVHWVRQKSVVRLCSAQGAIRQWEPGDRPIQDAVRDDVLEWAMAVEHLGFGHLRATIGAQAWEAYRAKWCGGQMWAGGSDPHKRIAREALAGGIALDVRRGELDGEWTYVDMSRCYRSIMTAEHIPCRSVSRLRRPHVSVLERAVERDCVIATVDLAERAWLAGERDHWGRLHWAGGRGISTLTTPDLVDALDAGVVRGVLELCTWTRGRPLAALGRGLADLEASLPSGVDSIVRRQIKPMANAVYGRLAMRSRAWKKWDTVDDDGLRVWSHWHADESRHIRWRQIGPTIERESDWSEHRWGHCAAAAHITAHGRARLRRLVKIADREHVAYVDTDGLIVDEEGLIRLQEAQVWDDWNLRVEARGECVIRGVRDGQIGTKQLGG